MSDNQKIFTLIGLCILAFVWSCKKDFSSENQSDSLSVTTDQLTLENAREYFSKRQQLLKYRSGYTDSVQQYLSSINLLWDFADSIMYAQQVPLILVPVGVSMNHDICTGNQISMAFFINNIGELDSRLFLIRADSTYTPLNSYVQNFTGNILQVNWGGQLVNSVRVNDGIVNAPVQSDGKIEFRNDAIDCPEGTILVTEMFDFVDFKISWSGCYSSIGFPTSNPTTPIHDPLGFGSPTHPVPDQTIGGGGSGGSGTNSLSNYFNLEDFEGTERQNAQYVNQIKDKYCLQQTAKSLLKNLSEKCGYSSDQKDIQESLKLIKYSTDPGELDDCVKDVIMEDRYHDLALKFGLDLSLNEFSSSISGECTASSNCVSDCMLEQALGADFDKKFANDPNWLDDVISEITLNAGDPAVDSNHPICAAIFDCKPLKSEPSFLAGGIKNLNIGLNINGSISTYQIERLYFTCASDVIANIGISMESLVAEAINRTIASAETRISNGNFVPSNQTNDPAALAKLTILSEFKRQLSGLLTFYGYGGDYAFTIQYVGLDLTYLANEGVNFVNFETDFALKCP